MSQNYCNTFWRALIIFPIIVSINLSEIPKTFAQSLPSPLETAVIEAVQQPGLRNWAVVRDFTMFLDQVLGFYLNDTHSSPPQQV